MKDIVFINPPHHGQDYYTPIGINMLDQLVRKAGYDSSVIDFQRAVLTGDVHWPGNFFTGAREILARNEALAFGFSVMNVGLPWALGLAELVRGLFPDAVIIFGGPHPTLIAEDLLRVHPVIDVIACHEGEEIVVQLLQGIKKEWRTSLFDVKNLCLRSNFSQPIRTQRAALIEDLDTVPFLDIDNETLKCTPVLSVEAGRGCPYQCYFCSSHTLWTRKPRYKSPERLVAEASRYQDQAGSRSTPLVISFEHDDFIAKPRWFKEFAHLKIASRTDFVYTISSRVDHLTDDTIHLLSKSGCISVFMGLETGVQRIQTISQKRLKVASILERLLKLRSEGIYVSANFIVGFPQETFEELCDNLSFMVSVRACGAKVNISVMCPEPGSELYDRTTPENRVMLKCGRYHDELLAGGFRPELMDPSETYHLMSIRNPFFDIEQVARFIQVFQCLLDDCPIALAALLGNSDTELSRFFSYFSTLDPSVAKVNHVLECLEFILTRLRTSQDLSEYVLYEKTRFSLKCKLPTQIPQFSANMPGAYHDYKDNLGGQIPRRADTSSISGGQDARVHDRAQLVQLKTLSQ